MHVHQDSPLSDILLDCPAFNECRKYNLLICCFLLYLYRIFCIFFAMKIALDADLALNKYILYYMNPEGVYFTQKYSVIYVQLVF